MRFPLLLRLLFLTLAAALLMIGCQPKSDRFDGKRALRHIEAQCDFGPRPVGSHALAQTAIYIGDTLTAQGWEVSYDDFAYDGVNLRNVIAKKGHGDRPTARPLIVLGAHYDTRPLADRDSSDRSQPVLGANDGASGTAVLLELARVLGQEATDQAEIWLVFFDGEDKGDLDGWPWCVGSQHMADQMAAGGTKRPEYVLIVDMIGDKDQRIFYEWSSALWLQEKVFDIAHDLGYEDHFVPEHRYRIFDDHSPFLQWGMTAAVIIDFDYPYWHTRYDTLDKVSADSLQRVGDVLEKLLEEEPFATRASNP